MSFDGLHRYVGKLGSRVIVALVLVAPFLVALIWFIEIWPITTLVYLAFMLQEAWKHAGIARGKQGQGMKELHRFMRPAVFGMVMLALLPVLGDAGVATALLVACVVMSSDIFAYFTGKLIGGKFIKRQFSEASPNKTWEGTFGGVIMACVIGQLILREVIPLVWEEVSIGFWPGVAIIGASAALAPMGDLRESEAKRALGIKDMSRRLDAHGGFCDRFDAIPFSFALVGPVIFAAQLV